MGRLASSKGGPAILKERLLDSNRGFPDLKRRVARLIASLDAEPFEEREKASEELRKVREDAEPMLRQALAGGLSAEARRRIAEILQGMQGTPPGRDMLRTLRAIEALEVSATDAAREALEALAKGAPDARLTQEAKAALKRLTPRSATP